jgi:Zn-dependent protease
MDIAQLIKIATVYALPSIFAITIHEAAHGYAARYFGDNTAWNLGRVTLNPSKHIDPIGTILMPLLCFVLSAGFIFGYAKPVPVRFGNLRDPKRAMIWVLLAGPAANLIQAMLWLTTLNLLRIFAITEEFFNAMCEVGVSINLKLFVFNLFPLPPLDGGRIMVGLLPMRLAMAFSRIEPYGFFIVIALIYIGVLDSLWMRPLVAISNAVLNVILTPLAMLAP